MAEGPIKDEMLTYHEVTTQELHRSDPANVKNTDLLFCVTPRHVESREAKSACGQFANVR
ncbi:hypothetical protein RvY_15174 [Ramazzottius varieornatus]|uniref:Uncharacterized protein n=1 Tax=Ramazzottius varieornatus TaxID=947166 RepID=A0A1D1VU05_RAMVA|nr:hypothetical protein RvY_15174 [Ramazzottius varieornatus]